MARLPRLFVPDQPQLILQRGMHGLVIAPDVEALAFLQATLSDAVRAQGIALHAYVLMPNHFHLLASAAEHGSIARTLQSLGRRYVQHFNQRTARKGPLWEGRYRSAVLDADQFLITAMRYIELNPVRSGLAADPAHYPWSSFRHHSGIESCAFLTDHAAYWTLGNTPFERQAAYKERAEQPLSEQELRTLRAATLGGWGIGSAAFLEQVSAAARRRAQPLARGRPPKPKPGDTA